MHYLRSVITEVDKTHSRLGKVVAFSIMAAKARKCTIIVSPAGMGKSTICRIVADACPEHMIIDAISEAGISAKQDAFNNYGGLIIVDDLGKLGSQYRRLHTLIAMAELVYTHSQKSYMWGNPIDITNFTGSTILNVQPAVFGSIVGSDEWEVVLQDKTIRYYHLYRPENPQPEIPILDLEWGIDLETVKRPTSRGKQWGHLRRIAQVQWSDARVTEHLVDMLRATAALDNRVTVTNNDYVMLLELMRPMCIEKYLLDKYTFESGRTFANQVLAVMIEVASWPKLTIERVARDYKLSPKRAGELLSAMGTGVVTVDNFTKVLSPSADLKRVLKEAGVKW